MIEKIDGIQGQERATVVELRVVSENDVAVPEISSDADIREQLAVTAEVLNTLAQRVSEHAATSSPDAERSQGRMGPDVLDLVST